MVVAEDRAFATSVAVLAFGLGSAAFLAFYIWIVLWDMSTTQGTIKRT